MFPALPNGQYVIIAKANEEDKYSYAFGNIQYTNFAMVEKKNKENLIYQIINRNNGDPIVGADCKINFYKNGGNNSRTKKAVTNSKGEVYLERSDRTYGRTTLEVDFEKENGFFESQSYYYWRGNHEKETIRANSFLFTDRSIYRPGQIVYFKGSL